MYGVEIAEERIKTVGKKYGNDASLTKHPPNWTDEIGVLNYLQEVADAIAYCSFNIAYLLSMHILSRYYNSDELLSKMFFWQSQKELQIMTFNQALRYYPHITKEDILKFDNDKAAKHNYSKGPDNTGN